MDRENLIISQQLNNLKAPSQNDGFLQKGRRRSKKDKVNRNYICGCSKTYLSYPALYTHIKNKHNSQAPKGTIVQSVNRPKKVETEVNSSMSKSNVNKSLIGEPKNNSANEDDDFMKGRLKDGHVIDKDFAKQENFNFDFSLEDFELVNFLGFQGNCDPEYSFMETKNVMDNQIQSMQYLENVKSFLTIKEQKITQEIDKLEQMKFEKTFVNSSNDELEDAFESDHLVLHTRKQSFENTSTLKKVNKHTEVVSVDKMIILKKELLTKIKNESEKIVKEPNEKDKNEDKVVTDTEFTNEENLKKICTFQKNPMFHIIRKGI